MKGSYQNHSGVGVGAEIWEVWQLLDGLNKDEIGCQYDIRHAVVEGGLNWKNGLKLIHSKINTMDMKDFKWEREGRGWKANNVPIGEGMVDFSAFFKLVRQYEVNVPVSLHLEYPLGGAEHGHKELKDWTPQQVFDAMGKDLQLLRKLWKEA